MKWRVNCLTKVMTFQGGGGPTHLQVPAKKSRPVPNLDIILVKSRLNQMLRIREINA